MTPHEKAVLSAIRAYRKAAGATTEDDFSDVGPCVAEAIDAYLAAMDEAGWQFVPVQPTPGMKIAGENFQHHGWQQVYCRMLAAAPSRRTHDDRGRVSR